MDDRWITDVIGSEFVHTFYKEKEKTKGFRFVCVSVRTTIATKNYEKKMNKKDVACTC